MRLNNQAIAPIRLSGKSPVPNVQPPPGRFLLVHLLPLVSDLTHTLRFLALRVLAAVERLQIGDFSA